MKQRILSEMVGTALFLAVITGSGVIRNTLSQRNTAVALLGNSVQQAVGFMY